jgi:DNA-binding protein HU-beta
MGQSSSALTKADLVDAVAVAAELSKGQAAKALTGVLQAITEALIEGRSVSLVGFGVFEVKARAARMGRNPRTGEPLSIAAMNMPQFKAGKALKEAVNVKESIEA